MASLINADGNWATLPMELLSMILTKLVLLPDYIRFGAVCKDWYRVAIDQEQQRVETCYQQPPMLFISGSQEQNCFFYSLWEHKVYNSHIPMIPDGIMNCGLCYGWLAIEQENAVVTLLNLFNGKIIHLPPLKITCPRKYNIFKVILSCDPCLHPNDCAIAAIYEQDQNVAIIRPGENSWTYLYHDFVDEEFEHVIDIYFYEGQLYAVNCFYELVAIDYSGSATSFDPSDNSRKDDLSVPSVGDILPQHGYISNTNYCQDDKASENGNLPQTSYNERDEYLHNDDLPDANFTEGHEVLCSVCYGSVSLEKLIWTDDWYVYSWNSDLVESFEGDLLLVQRNGYQGFSDEVTADFKILKLVMNHSSDDYADKARWVEIQSLGNSAIFLGVNHSICISATSFPNIQPNCIYYINTKHYPHETVDVGIFSLESRKIVECNILPDSLRYMSAAEWISPKLGVRLKKPVQYP